MYIGCLYIGFLLSTTNLPCERVVISEVLQELLIGGKQCRERVSQLSLIIQLFLPFYARGSGCNWKMPNAYSRLELLC